MEVAHYEVCMYDGIEYVKLSLILNNNKEMTFFFV